MTDKQKIEILEREVKHLTDENKTLAESLSKYTDSDNIKEINEYKDKYEDVLNTLYDCKRKYDALTSDFLIMKKNYEKEIKKLLKQVR